MHMGTGWGGGGNKLSYTYSDSSDGEESTQTSEVVTVRNNRCREQHISTVFGLNEQRAEAMNNLIEK